MRETRTPGAECIRPQDEVVSNSTAVFQVEEENVWKSSALAGCT